MRHKHCPCATWKRCPISSGDDTQAVVRILRGHKLQGFRADVIVSPSPCHVLMLSVCVQVVVVGHHRCCHMFGLKFAARAKHSTHTVGAENTRCTTHK